MRSKLLLLTLASVAFMMSCKRSETASMPNTQQPSPTEATSASPVSASTSPASSQLPAAAAAPAEKPKTDACALLSSKEIESVQGEPVKETKLTARSDGGFSTSQCFFTLPTFTNSVSLAVTQKADTERARNPKEFWRETFHRDAEEVKREREREGEGEEEEGAPPQKVRGIGDEAFWMGSRVGGALYVLKGSSYVRVSIGGAGDQSTKIKKSKALAQKAIGRL